MGGNLIPLTKRTKDEQRKIRQMGGRASGISRRRNRDLKKAVVSLLASDIPTHGGKTLTGAEGIAQAMVGKALKGDLKAIQQLLDLLYGRKQKVEMEGNVVTRLPDLNITFLPGPVDEDENPWRHGGGG